jgi:hypothetical protein
MANRRTPKPTGRRVRGYISDLVELSAPRALWTALVYHQDYRDDAVLQAGADRIAAFATAPGVDGVPPLVLTAPGVFAYDTGEIRSTRELVGAARGGIGWRAATEWFIAAATILEAASTATGLPAHGSLDPHRILVDYDGTLRVIGFGLPRLDLVDFLDDASLLPPTESLRYTAPESLEGADEDFGTDLFVLGLIAARLGGGHQLYGADDPKALLATAADGEAHAALKRVAPDCPALPWLGAVLEPWPEDRPDSIAAAVDRARTLIDGLEGPTLAEAMDAHAETASDVEVDLPRGWVLPVPPPPLDEERREQATRKLKRSHGEASRALERTLERLPPLEARDWSLSPSGREAFDEARRHVQAAREAVATAADALERAAAASTHPALDSALAEGEDACDRARGANAEALRALDRATTDLSAAEAERAAVDRAARADAAQTLVTEAGSLQGVLDDLDAQTGPSVTTAAREQVHQVVKDLRAYAEDPADPAGLDGLRTALASARTAVTEAERAAEAQQAAAEAAAAEEARLRHEQTVADLDRRIAALVELAAPWEALVARGHAIGGDPTSLDTLHASLRSTLASLEQRVGHPETDETTTLLADTANTLRDGTAALEAEVDALQEARDRADADAAERQRVRDGMARSAEEARTLAKEARAAERALSLAHPHATPVSDALDTLRTALADVERAAEALQSLELEPDDEPASVLDAAHTHLDFARNASVQVQDALHAARTADEAETARLGAEEAARARALVDLRQQLAATGQRVREAASAVRTALEEAEAPCRPLLSSLATRNSAHLGPLERALDALRQHQALLLGRQTNWEQMAEPAAELDDTESLEALVHTGDAEASFAEADLQDLPELVDAFQRVLALATAEQQVHDDRLAAARARVDAARAALDAAERDLPARLSIPAQVRDDDPIQALEDELLRAAEAARGALATARTRVADDLEQVPTDDWLDAVEAATTRATDRVEDWTAAHASLSEAIDARMATLQAEEAAREAAHAEATAALARLQAAHARADVDVPRSTDDAVTERTSDTATALADALADVPACPRVDLDDDPIAAAAALTPLVEPTERAAERVVAAHEAHKAAITAATELVHALRAATQRGESAADDAAGHGAEARELLQGLMGTWPHLTEQQEALREAVAAVERHASAASEHADVASDAARADEGYAAAERAEQAAAAAMEALDAARPLYDALRQAVDTARKEAAAADEQRRLGLIEDARSMTTDARELRERLDTASQEAVTALEDSPSHAARAAWEAADEALDAANARLSALDDALQGVFSASTADDAAEQLTACTTHAEAAPALVQRAVEAAHAAAVRARKDADANEELVVALQGTRIAVEEMATEIREARQALSTRADALDPRPEAVGETLAALDTHGDHVASALAELATARDEAMAAPDDQTRARHREVAADVESRGRAALNTARALIGRAEQAFVAAERAEAERRTAAVATLRRQHDALVADLSTLESRASAVQAADDADALEDALGAVVRALEAVREVVASSAVRLEQATDEVPSRMLEHLVRQGERTGERMQERRQAVEQAIDGVDAARRAIVERRRAAHQAFVERMGALRVDVDERLEEARHITREARASLESARPLLGNSPAAAAAKAWTTATEAVESSETSLERALDLRDTWPDVPTDTDSDDDRQARHEAALQLAEQVRDAAARAIAEAGAIQGLVDMGLRSAEALAGILGDAGEVRGRFQTFEEQIRSRHEALAAAMEHAPTASASRLEQEARIELEELDETLVEARACLEELGEATSAEQAEALLEVATVSLDILESVLEYALPTVDHATRVAEAEAASLRERRERQEAARAALDVALAPERSPADTEDAIGAAMTEAAVLERHASVRDAIGALSKAVETYTLAHDAFAFTIPDDPDPEPDVLEALLAEVSLARQGLDAAQEALDTTLSDARDAIEAARVVERQRQEELARLQEAFAGHRRALDELRAEAVRRRDATLEATAAFPDEGPLEREALAQAVASLETLVLVDALEEEPAAWRTAVEQAALVLESARAIDVVGPAVALVAVVEDARAAAEARAARIQALREALEVQRGRLEALRSASEQTLTAARKTAADYPLEAGLPLAALEASHEAIHAVSIADDVPDDPEAAAALVERATSLVEQLADHDLAALAAEVDAAVDEAVEQERQAAAELARHHATLEQAAATLQAVQDESRAVHQRLAHAATWPEVDDAWTTFSTAYDKALGLRIDDARPTQLPVARKAAQRAERILAEAEDWRPTVPPLERALDQARQARVDARERIDVARGAAKARVEGLGERIAAATDLPDTEPVIAAYRALEVLLATLIDLLDDTPVPDDAPLGDLLPLAEAAEAAELDASLRDIDGLWNELQDAITAAREAEAAEEAQRIETIQQARETLKTAIDALTEGLDLRGASLADLPADTPDPLGRRSEARNALESARGILVDLRSARDTLGDFSTAAEAVTVAFDAESKQAEALHHLFTVDSALDDLLEDGRRLAEIRARAAADMEVVTARLESIQAILDDVAEPLGEEASALSERLDNQALDLAALRATAELALAAVQEAADATTAGGAAERLRGLIAELTANANRAREDADALRAANQRHVEREAAARLEDLAAAKERATLAAERADRCLEDLGVVLASTSRLADENPDDVELQLALTALATDNETLLALVDTAREQAQAAQEARDPGRSAAETAETADRAEALVAAARSRLEEVDQRLRDAREQRRAAQEAAEKALLTERDALVPTLREAVDKLVRRLDRFRPPEPSDDEALDAANDAVARAYQATREACDQAVECVDLLASAKADDVPDFRRDAEKAVAACKTAATALEKAMRAQQKEQEAAEERRASLALEEARGRAWEACQLVQSLSTDLTRARAALPEIPTPTPPRLREALDRLAEVERRLWRAGQRADEARERAGQTEVLTEAESAAEAAEKAVGSAARWEREIDRALSAVTRLVTVAEEPVEPPKSDRIRNLRRGRLTNPSATPAPAPDRDEATSSPAEALLARLRSGKKRGESGRERLKRLRNQRPDPEPADKVTPLDPVALPPTSTDYPSLQEFEDYQATTVEAPPDVRPDADTAKANAEATLVDVPAPSPSRRKRLLERKRPGRRAAREPDPDFQDAKTQAFNREMIDAMLEGEGAPAWVDEEPSTRWETEGPESDD